MRGVAIVGIAVRVGLAVLAAMFVIGVAREGFRSDQPAPRTHTMQHVEGRLADLASRVAQRVPSGPAGPLTYFVSTCSWKAPPWTRPDDVRGRGATTRCTWSWKPPASACREPA